jgi:cystathionine beta-lyase/cystathionine gamma-synthase
MDLKEKIFKEGKFTTTLVHSGMRQNIEFELKTITIAGKNLKVLFTEKPVNLNDLIKLAEQLDIPIQSKTGLIYPPGKKASDFFEK